MAKHITREQLIRVINSKSTWLSQVVSWRVDGAAVSFDYYACWVDDIQRWFLTGADDWYSAKGGITTEQLLNILAGQEVISFWVSTDWQEIT